MPGENRRHLDGNRFLNRSRIRNLLFVEFLLSYSFLVRDGERNRGTFRGRQRALLRRRAGRH
ncbi:hypothetical protein D3C83_206300 [compost metagenome]